MESGRSISETQKKKKKNHEGRSASWEWFKAVVFSLPCELERYSTVVVDATAV